MHLYKYVYIKGRGGEERESKREKETHFLSLLLQCHWQQRNYNSALSERWAAFSINSLSS